MNFPAADDDKHLVTLLQNFVKGVNDYHQSMEPKFASVKFHLIPARFAKPYTYYLYEQQRVQEWLEVLPRIPSSSWKWLLSTDIVLFQILSRIFLANQQEEIFQRWFQESAFRNHPHSYFQQLRSCRTSEERRAQVLQMTPGLYHDLDLRPPTDWSLFFLSFSGPLQIW